MLDSTAQPIVLAAESRKNSVPCRRLMVVERRFIVLPNHVERSKDVLEYLIIHSI